jgi:hypothetical protein
MATQNPITVSSGQVVVDTSIVPFIRKSDVAFVSADLKPYKTANFFFDEVAVNRFVQKPSVIVLENPSVNVSFAFGEGLFNSNNGAYATVIDTAQNGRLYLNENYITLNVNSLTSFSSGDYSKGDVIYQNDTGTANVDATSNTFMGKVEYWDSAKKILVITGLSGTVNTQSGAGNTFFKVAGRTANVVTKLGNTATTRFATNHIAYSASNTSNTFNISSYTMNSGQFSFANNDLTVLRLSSNVSSAVETKTLYITSGPGIGQSRVINSVDTALNTITLASPLSTAPTNESRYSVDVHTVNEYGRLSGIFNIPEDPLLKFRTGERLFTITDSATSNDPDAQMKSTSRYIASGLLNTKQEVRFTPIVVQPPPALPPVNTPPPAIPRRRRDPVAQTFFTPQPKSTKQNYGIFISSVDLFFKAKPTAAPLLPVSVRIVTTVNGFPTTDIIASATVYPSAVNVTDGTTVLPDSTVSSTYTRFRFGDPVYLEADSEYAIVVFSESPDYEVWISEIGQNLLGTNRRVSEQPYAGSFFRSQNASTWTPFQNQDLMFVINKAVFTTSPGTLFFNVESPIANVNVDSFLLHSTDITFPVASINYFANTTLANNLSRDASFFELNSNEIYNFGKDLKNSSKSNNRRRLIRAGNGSSFNVQVGLLSSDTDITPMFNLERFSMIAIENLINNAPITNNNITITDGGGGRHSNAANITVTITAPQLSNGVQATANVLSSGIVNGNVVAINIIQSGSGYIESPTITLTDVSPTMAGYANAALAVISENSNYGGNSKTRYITRKITLADGFDAGDLRVYLRAVRPQGTNVIAYYKVLSTEDNSNFFNKNWQRFELFKDVYSPDQDTEVELQFRPSISSGKLSYTENSIEYPLGGKFKNFAIKLVLLAEDPTVAPYVKNIRAIATPEG